MGKRLFLIGNGFDLAHKLPTRYLDLLKWLYKNDNDTFMNLNKLLLRNFLKRNGYFYEDEYWYKRPKNEIDIKIDELYLEENKARLKNIEKSTEYNILNDHFDDPLILYFIWSSLEDYLYLVFLDEESEGIDMERESIRQILKDEEYGQVTEDDINYVDRPEQANYDHLRHLAKNFKYDLLNWVDTVNDEIPWIDDIIYYENEHGKMKIMLLPDNYFKNDDYIINFNYSNTIEKLYSMGNVFHIHGQDYYDNPPIMGHTKNILEMNEYDDRKLVLVEEFYKDFDLIIESNNDYFSKINDVNEIVVLGMGYTETDKIYFKKINKILPNAKWKLHYYSNEDLKKAEGYVDDIGIESYDYISLKEDSPYTNIVRYDLDD